MKLTGISKHLIHRDNMLVLISELAAITFQGKDPEMEWAFFRSELRQLKKEYKASYDDYMESDDDTEYPESEWSKFKRESRS